MKHSGPATAAIALSKFRLSETSLIVAWMTEDSGQLRTTVRGALRPRSPFAGKIDLYHETRITFQLSGRGDLHALREVELVHPFSAGSLPYAATLAAGYFARWIELVTQPLEPAPTIYSLLQRAFRYLREGKLQPSGITHFERELARLLGIADPGPTANHLVALTQYAGRQPAGRDTLLRQISANSERRD